MQEPICGELQRDAAAWDHGAGRQAEADGGALQGLPQVRRMVSSRPTRGREGLAGLEKLSIPPPTGTYTVSCRDYRINDVLGCVLGLALINRRFDNRAAKALSPLNPQSHCKPQEIVLSR